MGIEQLTLCVCVCVCVRVNDLPSEVEEGGVRVVVGYQCGGRDRGGDSGNRP